MDKAWWDVYFNDVDANFRGQLVSSNPIRQSKVTKLNKTQFKTFFNSGADAVSLAYFGNAKKIILLGYDCQKTEGKTHWHGDHIKGLGNAKRIENWADKFKLLAEYCENTTIINATRQTALNCFEKMPLEMALNE